MTSHNRITKLLDAQQGVTGTEWGAALNAAGFATQAQDHLRDGNYAEYLCCMELAGSFAKQARDEYYARTV